MSNQSDDAAEAALLDDAPSNEEFRRDVLAGLRREPKTAPCKYLYDQRGSELFDRICEQPEYFNTRTETAIMERNVEDIDAALGARCAIIEYGSGSSIKTRILLDHLESPTAYVPIDISQEHLLASAEVIRERYPDLPVIPVCADYTRPFDLPDLPDATERRVVYFPGSTIGNFDPTYAVQFLRGMRDVAGPDGLLLVGAALKTDPDRLIPAYDDSAGVTAAFNLNLLQHINRELGADFDLQQFEHRAVWNEHASRIEMHLVSRRDQDVRIGEETVHFEPGESIHTENSYKYDLERFRALAAEAGLVDLRVWTDPEGLFSVHLLSASE